MRAAPASGERRYAPRRVPDRTCVPRKRGPILDRSFEQLKTRIAALEERKATLIALLEKGRAAAVHGSLASRPNGPNGQFGTPAGGPERSSLWFA
jgi:hypothetical protein